MTFRVFRLSALAKSSVKSLRSGRNGEVAASESLVGMVGVAWFLIVDAGKVSTRCKALHVCRMKQRSE